MNKKQTAILLALIFLLGLLLRLHSLGSESFWLDEGATALTIKKYSYSEILINTIKFGQILPDYYSSNLDLPTYYLILKFWTSMFGLNEFSLRFISAIFGSLSIILIYLISKEIFDSNAGVISALLLSTSIVMIEYSQEARLYSFLAFIALLSGYFLVSLIKTNSNKLLLAFIISNLIGIYIHYTFIFFVVFELVYLLYPELLSFIKERKIKLKKIHLCCIILLLAYIPLLPRLLRPSIVATHSLGKFSVLVIGKIFLQLNSWLYPSLELRNNLNNANFQALALPDWILLLSIMAVALMLSILFLKGIYASMNAKKKLHRFPVVWMTSVLAAAFIALFQTISTFGSVRHFLFIIPAYFIIASYGFSRLKWKYRTTLLTLYILLIMPSFYSYYANINNPQYREAALFLEDNIRNGDKIIVSIPSVKVPLSYYSSKLTMLYGVSNLNDAKSFIHRDTSVWLVLSTKYADQEGTIKSYFDKNYNLVEFKSFFDIQIYHYSK